MRPSALEMPSRNDALSWESRFAQRVSPLAIGLRFIVRLGNKPMKSARVKVGNWQRSKDGRKPRSFRKCDGRVPSGSEARTQEALGFGKVTQHPFQIRSRIGTFPKTKIKTRAKTNACNLPLMGERIIGCPTYATNGSDLFASFRSPANQSKVTSPTPFASLFPRFPTGLRSKSRGRKNASISSCPRKTEAMQALTAEVSSMEPWPI